MPLPTTAAVSPLAIRSLPTACKATDTGSTNAACSNGIPAGSGDDGMLRHGHQFGKRSLLPKFLARDAENPPLGTHVRLPASALLAFAATQ